MNEYGSDIAYQVRFEGTKTQRTRILFLTEVNWIQWKHTWNTETD